MGILFGSTALGALEIVNRANLRGLIARCCGPCSR